MRALPIGSRDVLLARRRSLVNARVAEEGLPLGLRGLGERGGAGAVERVLGLQRVMGNRATAQLLREPTRQKQDRDLEQEQRRDERLDRGRGSRNPLSAFETDWAGRMLLEHYLYGGGDKLEFRDDSNWTAYMTRSDRLRKQTHDRVIGVVAEMLRSKKLGKIGVFERFHAEVENGEGMVGYQYLHGTNKTVGDFEMWGSGNVSTLSQAGVAAVPGENPYAPDVTSFEAGTRIDLDLNYQWNDIIDPNYSYSSDSVKSVIAELISLGEAEGYQFAVKWEGTVSVFVAPGKGVTMVGGYPKT